MKKISLAPFLLLIALLIVPVSASTAILEKHYVEYEDQTQSQEVVYKSISGSYMTVNYPLDFLSVRKIENVDQISYIVLRIKDANSPIPEGRNELTYTIKTLQAQL